jgi:hypothetical protein
MCANIAIKARRLRIVAKEFSRLPTCALGHLKPRPEFVSFHFTRRENREMKRILETK